ncbi:MAG: thiamine pyrophosphate-binding protein [Gemmatimonadota bacterium]
MRVADYVMQALVSHGVTNAFVVTGGGAMHLNDALGSTEGLRWLPCHHEQACAIAAQGFARLTSRPALVQVTTGPGSTNALTGVFGAWVDSLPMIVVSGQVKRETLMRSYDVPGLRQLGDQEVDIVAMATPVTKYCVCVTDALTIRYHLERAVFEASHGRPGPVWLDIPVDVQAELIDPVAQEGFTPPVVASDGVQRLKDQAAEVARRLAAAKRPVVYLGSGVRLAGAAVDAMRMVERLGVPVVTGFNAHDLMESSHPLFAGRPGTIGDRPGNFAVQNSDCLLVIGCRLNIRQISYNWKAFARDADILLVDVDPAELDKPTLSPAMRVTADAGAFIDALLEEVSSPSLLHQEWVAWCRERRERYPVVLSEYWQRESPVNPYCFGDALSRVAADDEIIVTGDGTACIATFQAMRIRGRQRLFSDSGSAPMGFDLPAAVGACIASERRVVCIAGDGSLMMNLQELQTVAGHGLPVKIFVFNNDGYLSIKLTQRGFFAGRMVGSGPASGVTFPDFQRVAEAFGLPFKRISSNSELAASISEVLDLDGPAVCEVVLDPEQAFSPRVSSKRLPDGRMVTAPLEDMFPFLSRNELRANMLIPQLGDVES